MKRKVPCTGFDYSVTGAFLYAFLRNRGFLLSTFEWYYLYEGERINL